MSLRKLKKVLKRLALVTGAGMALLIVAMTIAGRDSPAPETGDLTVARVHLPPEENAYTYYNAAAKALYWPTNRTLVTDYLRGKEVDADQLADFFEKNVESLALIVRGNLCAQYSAPEISKLGDLPNPDVFDMARLLMARSRNSRLAGQYADATDHGIALLRFADRCLQGVEGGTYDYLISHATQNMGLYTARVLAREKKMPAADLERLAAALDTHGPSDAALARAFRTDYSLADDVLERFRDEKITVSKLFCFDSQEVCENGFVALLDYFWDAMKPSFHVKVKWLPGYFFKPHKTRQTLAGYYRDAIAEVPQVYAEMNLTDYDAALGLKDGAKRTILHPNLLGRSYLSTFVSGIVISLERKCTAECELAATRLMVACARYRQETGTLPESLNLLTPRYLPRIPRDPFDGQAFRYDTSRGILYSVGKDLIDGKGCNHDKHGRPSTELRDMRDLVYKIDLQPGDA